MSSSRADELEALRRSPASGSDLKSVLTRLHSEVRRRTEQSSVDSYDFFSRATGALSRIRGTSPPI